MCNLVLYWTEHEWKLCVRGECHSSFLIRNIFSFVLVKHTTSAILRCFRDSLMLSNLYQGGDMNFWLELPLVCSTFVACTVIRYALYVGLAMSSYIHYSYCVITQNLLNNLITLLPDRNIYTKNSVSIEWYAKINPGKINPRIEFSYL